MWSPITKYFHSQFHETGIKKRRQWVEGDLILLLTRF